MRKERKICIRITPGRIVGTILIAASMVNLVIVGAAFEVTFPDPVPTRTATLATEPAVLTPSAPTATATLQPTDTPTQTSTFTSSPTHTASPTSTSTHLPVLTACAPRYAWPVYIVQGGDTLYSLAIATGSSVDELMLANCLPDSRIYRGQRLYVPRLPVREATITPSFTPSITPLTPTDYPTIIQSSWLCYSSQVVADKPEYIIQSAVTVYDPQGINSVITSYRINNGKLAYLSMLSARGSYVGTGPLSSVPARDDRIQYAFTVTDNLGNVFNSAVYDVLWSSCLY